MGHGIAHNLVTKGWPLVVLGHRRRAPVEDLLGKGAHEVKNSADLAAASDVIFLCLPSSREVEAIVLGRGGLAEAMRPGQILVDSTTAEPSSTERIAAALAARDIAFVDAPLTRTAVDAIAGRLNVLIGGPSTTVEDLREVISAFAENIFHIGAVGSAHKLKLINNFLTIGTSTVVSEAVVAAMKLDVDVRRLFEIVSLGGANSATFQMILPWILDQNMLFAFTLQNAAKDLGYFAAATGPVGALGPVGAAIKGVLDHAVAEGRGADYVPQLVDVMTARDTPTASAPPADD